MVVVPDLWVHEQGVHPLNVRERGVREHLVQIGTVLSTNLVGQTVPSSARQPFEMRLVFGVQPDGAIEATELTFGDECSMDCAGPSHRSSRLAA